MRKKNFHNDKVKWVLEPNKDKITTSMRNHLLMQNESSSCGVLFPPGCPNIGNGKTSCTYKHYLCLQDIVENNYDYGIIMEDNQFFCGNIPETVEKYVIQLNEMYPDWDIIFDTKWARVQDINEVEVVDNVYVYPKSNEITNYCHGGTRLAQFYIVTNKCAKKMYENYIPFNNAPDWWMNDLFRKLNINSFWSEPSISAVYPHISTAD